MGGYAAFVWPGYALSLVALAWMIVLPVIQHGREIKKRNDEQGAGQ